MTDSKLEEESPSCDNDGKLRSPRTYVSLVFTVIIAVLLAVVVPVSWAKTTVLDTDRWVATIAPLADSPAIQRVVSENVSARIIGALDIQGIAEEHLPDEAVFLASPMANSIESMIKGAADSVVASEAFSNLWSSLSRSSHQAIVAAFTTVETNGALSHEDGTIALDVGIVAETVREGLVERGFGFVENIPTSFLSGEIVLFSSPYLAQVQMTFSFLNSFVDIGIAVMLVLLIGALLLTKDRRKVILWLGMGVFLVMLVLALTLEFAKMPLIDSLGFPASEKAAISDVYDIVLASLIVELKVIAFAGIVVGAFAMVAGNKKLQIKTNNLLSHASEAKGVGLFFRWVGDHRKGVLVSGFLAMGVFLLIQPTVSWGVLIGVAITLVVWVLIVSIVTHIASLGNRTA